MPETVRVDREMGVIFIDSRGDVKEGDLRQSLDSVLELVEREGITSVLVDATHLDSLPSTTPLFEFAREISRKAGKLKHAIVLGDEPTHDLAFIETVAQNRGTRMRTFTSVEDALSWLNG